MTSQPIMSPKDNISMAPIPSASKMGREKIRQFLEANTDVNGRCQLHDIHLDVSSALRSPRKTHLDAHGKVPGIEAFILINTSKAFSLYISLRTVNGFEEMIYGRRPKGVKHGSSGPRQNWSERRKIESEFEEAEPAVVIVGASQAGLGLAAILCWHASSSSTIISRAWQTSRQ
ncbi:FAD/NAD(P)-binding domain-containing protein [Penicillium robsamsonii]|uniref:FAD/NAD(P)-binding domain-containing protein n=1 Tax=Penicillium robsamsonii TaxID=1792511 RepID=UPI00254692BB|nr:FAD/NAD(P)-binding domain-containing protein [Penicillium robsamsonii]KAJ5835363.1 FAD/NAD(P)-binding domain-containing protein [Penicillium robsamsonii]